MSKAASKKEATQNPTFADYWKKGIAVIPEIDKYPQVNGEYIKWGKFYKENYKPSEDELLEWDLLDGHDKGLVTGEPSDVVIMDWDYAQPEQIKRGLELLGDSPVKKIGTKGVSVFYKYNGEKNENWSKDGKILVELLSTGRKSTIPPSKCKNSKGRYYWETIGLLDAENLPTLPKDYSDKLNSLFSIIKEPYRENPVQHYDMKPSFAEACMALGYCDANCDNDSWVRIGMSFKSEVGEAGFNEFDNWSSKGKSYDKRSIYSRWRSFDSRSIGYGTLVYYAKQGGYVVPEAEAKVISATEVEDWSKRELERKAELIHKSNELPAFYVNAPDHIKVICEWILSTSMYPQPIITLGSVLAFLGFIMGRDFEFNSLKPNLYVANIAYSADGKEHINRCIRGLMNQFDMKRHISYGWTSDTAIIEKLDKNDGRIFYLTDELQAALRAIANKSTNSRESAATEKLLQAYTGIEVSTTDYADSKDRPTKSVKNPFITICGYTTPAIFEMCLGSTEVFSGFVGRLTVFRGNEFIPEENVNFHGNAWKNIPSNVGEVLEKLRLNRIKKYNQDGNFIGHEVKEIPTKCLDLIREYREKIRIRRNDMRSNGDGMEPVFGRAGEMMLKYAMIASQGAEIKSEHIHWAVSVVEYNLSIICEVAKGFSDNKFERNKARLLQFISNRPGKQADKSTIATNCRAFDGARERKEALEDLVDSGKLEVIKIESSGQKSKTAYRVVPELL